MDSKLVLQDDMIAYSTAMLSEDEFSMHVLDILPANILLVDLIDKTTEKNVKDVLLEHISSTR